MSKKQIKVLMIIGSLGDGGKERQLLLLLKSLKDNKEIQASLMVMNSGGERENEAEQLTENLVSVPGKRGMNLVKPLRTMIRQIKQNEIDIVHTWGSGIWDLMGLIAGRYCRKPVIHNGIRSAPSHLNIYNQLTRLGANFADVVVANSFAGLRSFRLIDRENSRVIHNGLDTSRFQDVELISEGQNLCMVANFRKAKDHHSLMFAMPEVIKRFPNVRLNLVGHDYGTFDEIQELAKTLEISKHVDFITDCTQPEPIIGRSQIGILSTHGEGLSNSLLEYMALSKPVIVSNNGGNPEVVIDNTTGFLVPPGSSDAINEKLLFLLDNPEIARIMGEKGRSRVEDQFSNEKMVKDYINLDKEMIASE